LSNKYYFYSDNKYIITIFNSNAATTLEIE